MTTPQYDYDAYSRKIREPLFNGKYISDLTAHELHQLVMDVYRQQDEKVLRLLQSLKGAQEIHSQLRQWKQRLESEIADSTTKLAKDVILEMTEYLASIRDDIVPNNPPNQPPVTTTDSLDTQGA